MKRQNGWKKGWEVPAASALCIAVSLSGCGGDDGAAVGSGGSGAAASVAIGGRVADGYLVGAKVCLDKNANRVCDAGEPSANSTAGGAFEIAGLTQADIDQYPLAAEATPATTKDEDISAAVLGAFTLSTPKGLKDSNGKYHINAVTSLMQQYLIDNPTKTNADAETAVKATLGGAAGASLAEDFVARKTESAYAPLFKAAQVITRTMGQAQTDLGAAATQSLIMGYVNDSMVDILSVANTAANFDATTGVITPAASAALLNGSSLSPVATIRTTTFGKVAGKRDGGAYAWLGVPYAAPPVNELRWKAPTDHIAWTKPRAARQFGNACMQTGSFWGPQPAGDAFGLSLKDTFGQIVGSEDCLTLNIWQPETGETNLPVLVFIHGGGHALGWSGTPDFSGANFAKAQKAVVVSVNYRLNVFGWLKHAALETSDPLGNSGNFGTLDLIQALKFVKNNIAQFGGDPKNVTISGQSAGAQNVWSLIVSPVASGLFHKAVPMSQGQRGATVQEATAYSDELLRQLVIKQKLAVDTASADAYIKANLGTSAQVREFLYKRTAAELVEASSSAGKLQSLIYDGVVQPASAALAFDKVPNPVPVLSGVTQDEGKTWGYRVLKTTAQTSTERDAQLWQYQMNFNPDGANGLTINDLVKPEYLDVGKPFVSCSNTGYNGLMLPPRNYFVSNSENWATCNGGFNTRSFWSVIDTTLDKYRAAQPSTNIYAYNFAWAQQPEPWKTFFGSSHVADVAFVFGNFGPGLYSNGYSTANKPGREALSNVMQQSLMAFMKTGNPNNTSLGATTWSVWPGAGKANRVVFNADNSTPVISASTVTWQTR